MVERILEFIMLKVQLFGIWNIQVYEFFGFVLLGALLFGVLLVLFVDMVVDKKNERD